MSGGSGGLTGQGNGADRDQLKSAKIAVLRLINENRDVLFGKLSDSLSREAKEAKWAEVAEHAHALGAFPSHRSWDYLKDTTWQNWRKRFVEKRDKKEKYDLTGIGTKVVYDEADLLINEILDALGRNGPSPQASHQNYSSPSNNNSHYRDISEVLEIEFDAKNDDGDDVSNEMYQANHVLIGEGENGSGSSGSSYSLTIDANMENGDYPENGYDQEEDEFQHYIHEGVNGLSSSGSLKRESSAGNTSHPKIVSTSSLSSTGSTAALLRKYGVTGYRSATTTAGGGFARKRPSNFLNSSVPILKEKDDEKELVQLKCKKIRAELELLEREAYKRDLEILQLERSLGLPASHITQKFYKSANNVNRGVMKNR